MTGQGAPQPAKMSRLTSLAAVGALAVATLAGCTGGDPAASASTTGTATAPGGPTPTTGIYSPELGDVDAVHTMLAQTIGYSSLDHSPDEGAWNYPLEAEGFEAIAEAGFTAVRLPVRFSAHQQSVAPYTIDEAFLERVDWAVEQALSNGLAVIIDNHHWGIEGGADFDSIFTDPASQKDRLLALWDQVATRYADRPAGVVFEMLNEPHDKLDAVWNEYLADTLAVIRESNPDRAVIVGPGSYNSAFALWSLELPDDENLIVTFHDYVPFDFTHQGATWVGEVPPVGVVWPQPTVRMNTLWADWSWGMDRTLTADGLEVQANQDWAGVFLHSDQGVAGATAIEITLDQRTELWIDCRVGEEGAQHTAHVTAEADTPLTVSVASCGLASPTLKEIRIMVGEHPTAHFTVTQVRILSAADPVSIFVSAEDEMLEPLEIAAQWSRANGDVPMFLGEFGASHLGDQASRDRWIRAVRGAAESRGIAWSYWDFQGTWGFWTPSGGVTAPWVRDAIMGR